MSRTMVKDKSKGNDINVHGAGRNEAQIGSWDIDQFTKLKVTTSGDIKKDHILTITGTISGDDFPNQESILYDSKGNAVWLGNFETQGNRQWGPVFDLPRTNEGDVQMNISISLRVNKDGVFQGVMEGDKMISIDDWNKKFEGSSDER